MMGCQEFGSLPYDSDIVLWTRNRGSKMKASTCCPSHICIETKPEVVMPEIFGLQGCQVLIATCCYISQATHITSIILIHLLYQDDQLDPDCRGPFFHQGTCEAIAGIPNSRLGQAALPICLHLTPWQKNHLGIWEAVQARVSK